MNTEQGLVSGMLHVQYSHGGGSMAWLLIRDASMHAARDYTLASRRFGQQFDTTPTKCFGQQPDTTQTKCCSTLPCSASHTLTQQTPMSI